jgi:hypothetical protein
VTEHVGQQWSNSHRWGGCKLPTRAARAFSKQGYDLPRPTRTFYDSLQPDVELVITPQSISSRSTHYSNIIKYEYFDSNDVPVEYPNTPEYR